MTTTELFNDDKLMQHLGARLIKGEPGHVVIELKVTENLVQRHNTCQGGAIFALADAAFGIAANNTGQSAVSQHCTISFLRPDRSGELIAEFRGNAHILKSS